MINLSTEKVSDGFQIHPYQYIIIDEYQDISFARYKLVKAILDQTKAKLLCVGDDWQSIYRLPEVILHCLLISKSTSAHLPSYDWSRPIATHSSSLTKLGDL